MSRALTVKSRRSLLDATPQPAEWPVCGECGHEFVLRRALLAKVGGKSMDLRIGWTWVRDCKHRKVTKPDRVDRERQRSKP